jgi:hypothetical protein
MDVSTKQRYSTLTYGTKTAKIHGDAISMKEKISIRCLENTT